MNIRMALLVAAMAGCAGIPPLEGAVLFSTLGPGGSYSTTTKYGQDGNTGYQAFLFQPASTATLTSITVALAQQTPIANQTRFQLYSGDATNLITLLETWVVANLAPEPGTLVTMQSLTAPTLSPGSYYWLAISEPDAPNGPNSLWYFNNQGKFGTRKTSFGLAPGSAMAAFQVDGNLADAAVPEPAAGWLVGLVLGLGGMRALKLRS